MEDSQIYCDEAYLWEGGFSGFLDLQTSFPKIYWNPLPLPSTYLLASNVDLWIRRQQQEGNSLSDLHGISIFSIVLSFYQTEHQLPGYLIKTNKYLLHDNFPNINIIYQGNPGRTYIISTTVSVFF